MTPNIRNTYFCLLLITDDYSIMHLYMYKMSPLPPLTLYLTANKMCGIIIGISYKKHKIN